MDERSTTIQTDTVQYISMAIVCCFYDLETYFNFYVFVDRLVTKNRSITNNLQSNIITIIFLRHTCYNYQQTPGTSTV